MDFTLLVSHLLKSNFKGDSMSGYSTLYKYESVESGSISSLLYSAVGAVLANIPVIFVTLLVSHLLTSNFFKFRKP